MTPASKRALDIVVGGVLAVISLPLLVVAAAAASLALRASPFFVHERVGEGGRPFRLVKIRTLPPDTGRYVDKFALDVDRLPRTTRALRALHLDELPQLWLVLAGKMSLVGPRPEMRVLHDRLDARFAAERCRVRPGLTGLWQISPHCTGLIGQRPEYDRIYIEHQSLRLDLWIAFRTLLKILGRGTVHLFDVPKWTFEGGAARRPAALAPSAAATPEVVPAA